MSSASTQRTIEHEVKVPFVNSKTNAAYLVSFVGPLDVFQGDANVRAESRQVLGIVNSEAEKKSQKTNTTG